MGRRPAVVSGDGGLRSGCRVAFRGGCLDPHEDGLRAACSSLMNGRRLTPHEQTVLIFTALFHDAAKPLTSQVDPETGRITLTEARRQGRAPGPVGPA